MKKLTILIAMLMATSAWAEWLYLVDGEDTTYYADYSSVERDGDKLYVWTMTDFHNSDTSMLSSTHYRYIECGIPRKYKFLSFNSFQESMGKGISESLDDQTVLQWRYPAPGTVGQIIVDTFCAMEQ